MNALAYAQGFLPNSDGEPIIRFYAIAILLGALVALFLSSYRAHKDGYDWTFFGTIFLVAFPCGIIGARIWFVIAEWKNFAADPFPAVFEIWRGGLAIQGGAIGGVLAGALVAFFFRKGTPLLKCTDYAVPTILVAQAIGRWGNFFNQEVFGHAVTPQSWSFLPGFITYNMQNGNLQMGGQNGVLPSGSIAAPLFLVEGMLNVAFFILITKGLTSALGKRYKDGDSTFAYFIAYGLVRFLLEPMRNSQFIMGGVEDQKSTGMAVAFIAIGAVLIIINHVLRLLSDRHLFDKVPFLGDKVLPYLRKRATEVVEMEVSSSSSAKGDGFVDLDKIKALEKKEDDGREEKE